jgi:hypothetical protein
MAMLMPEAAYGSSLMPPQILCKAVFYQQAALFVSQRTNGRISNILAGQLSCGQGCIRRLTVFCMARLIMGGERGWMTCWQVAMLSHKSP